MATRLTRAQERVMRKAVARGRIMIAGGFGGTMPMAEAIDDPAFDRRESVDCLLKRKFLAPGAATNTYEPTPRGRKALARRLAAQARRAAAEATPQPERTAHAQGSPA